MDWKPNVVTLVDLNGNLWYLMSCTFRLGTDKFSVPPTMDQSCSPRSARWVSAAVLLFCIASHWLITENHCSTSESLLLQQLLWNFCSELKFAFQVIPHWRERCTAWPQPLVANPGGKNLKWHKNIQFSVHEWLLEFEACKLKLKKWVKWTLNKSSQQDNQQPPRDSGVNSETLGLLSRPKFHLLSEIKQSCCWLLVGRCSMVLDPMQCEHEIGWICWVVTNRKSVSPVQCARNLRVERKYPYSLEHPYCRSFRPTFEIFFRRGSSLRSLLLRPFRLFAILNFFRICLNIYQPTKTKDLG